MQLARLKDAPLAALSPSVTVSPTNSSNDVRKRAQAGSDSSRMWSAALQRDEPRVGDLSREFAPHRKGDTRVVLARRITSVGTVDGPPRSTMSDVRSGLENPRSDLRLGRDATRRSLNQRTCSSLASGTNTVANSLRNAGFSSRRAGTHEFVERAKLDAALRSPRRSAPRGTARGQHQMRKVRVPGVADRAIHCNGASLRDADEGEAIPLRRSPRPLRGPPDLRGQKVKIGHVPNRKAAATGVVADETMSAREKTKPVTPDRALPVELEV